jgi:endogenous inhibitor of DNA gyrase (YacG/DUF329 family)
LRESALLVVSIATRGLHLVKKKIMKVRKKKMIIPDCPICGAELEVDDIYNTDVDDTGYIECVCGHCPSCQKEFEWENIGEISEWRCEELREV